MSRSVMIQYHNIETKEDTVVCPSGPVFVESVWTSTRIDHDETGGDIEVHLLTVDYRIFKYA